MSDILVVNVFLLYMYNRIFMAWGNTFCYPRMDLFYLSGFVVIFGVAWIYTPNLIKRVAWLWSIKGIQPFFNFLFLHCFCLLAWWNLAFNLMKTVQMSILLHHSHDIFVTHWLLMPHWLRKPFFNWGTKDQGHNKYSVHFWNVVWLSIRTETQRCEQKQVRYRFFNNPPYCIKSYLIKFRRKTNNHIYTKQWMKNIWQKTTWLLVPSFGLVHSECGSVKYVCESSTLPWEWLCSIHNIQTHYMSYNYKAPIHMSSF